ncbi:MAG TPA: mannosyltransferase family protein [Candidatus Dormibacteraeota bacterium]
MASRALLGLAAGVANLVLRYGRPQDPQHAWPLQPWLSWDAVHYLQIARAGYPAGPRAVEDGFFPLLPMLLRLLGASDWAAVGLAFLLGLSGLAVLAGLTAQVWDRPTAVRVTWIAAFWPAALFWSAVYTEGLFLALAAGSLWAAWRGHAAVATLLAAGAALLRPNGLMLALPLLVLLPAGRARLAALAPVLGAAAFALYLWAFSGDPLAFVGGQADHHPLAVGRPLARLLSLDPEQVVGLGFLLVAAAGAAWLWTRRELGAWRLAGPVTVLALLAAPLASGSLASFGRYTMVAFPLSWSLQRLPAPLLLAVGLPASLAYTVLAGTGRLTP